MVYTASGQHLAFAGDKLRKTLTSRTIHYNRHATHRSSGPNCELINNNTKCKSLMQNSIRISDKNNNQQGCTDNVPGKNWYQ